jgi:hypothetical protein
VGNLGSGSRAAVNWQKHETSVSFQTRSQQVIICSVGNAVGIQLWILIQGIAAILAGNLLSIEYRESLRVELTPGQVEWEQPGAACFNRAVNMGNNLTSKSRFPP